MNEKIREEVALHSAGAIVRHEHPFAHLLTPQNSEAMTQETRDKWVIPFYLKSLQSTVAEFLPLCREATPEMTLHLLGEKNWRPRVVGARIVAVRRFEELQPAISNLLLQSEVCFAGVAYCEVLVAFGSHESAKTLCKYLDYYLRCPDLWFDQGTAMSSLQYLDKALTTNYSEQFLHLWQRFIRNKPNWKLDEIQFDKQMAIIKTMHTKI